MSEKSFFALMFTIIFAPAVIGVLGAFIARFSKKLRWLIHTLTVLAMAVVSPLLMLAFQDPNYQPDDGALNPNGLVFFGFVFVLAVAMTLYVISAVSLRRRDRKRTIHALT